MTHCWCNRYPTKDLAWEASSEWERLANRDNRLTTKIYPAGEEWELRVCTTDRELGPALESDYFEPCDTRDDG
jgi:hypothetical protein